MHSKNTSGTVFHLRYKLKVSRTNVHMWVELTTTDQQPPINRPETPSTLPPSNLFGRC